MTRATDTTRRAMLGGIGLAAVAATSVAAAPIASAPAVSPKLAGLLRDFRRSDNAINRWYKTVWNPACERHTAAIDSVPHIEVVRPAFVSILGTETPAQTMTTANSVDVAVCRGILSVGTGYSPETVTAARKLVRAAKRREGRVRFLHRLYNRPDLDEREAELWEPVTAASDAIKAFPVASAADLAAKLEHAREVDWVNHDPEAFQTAIGADAQRLAAKEGR